MEKNWVWKKNKIVTEMKICISKQNQGKEENKKKSIEEGRQKKYKEGRDEVTNKR